MAIKDKEEDARRYKTEFNISTPVMIDDGKVANTYGVWSHPETFFINREGKIVGRVLKEADWSSGDMKHLIRSLLKEGR